MATDGQDPKGPGASRRSKVDPQRFNQIANTIALGVPEKFAAMSAGISERTLRYWITRGKQCAERRDKGEELDQESTDFAAFFDKVKRARGTFVAVNVAGIAKAAEENWQARAWLLERRYPEEFARRERLEHSGPKGNAIQVSQSVTLDEARKAMQSAVLNETLMNGHAKDDGADDGKLTS